MGFCGNERTSANILDCRLAEAGTYNQSELHKPARLCTKTEEELPEIVAFSTRCQLPSGPHTRVDMPYFC